MVESGMGLSRRSDFCGGAAPTPAKRSFNIWYRSASGMSMFALNRCIHARASPWSACISGELAVYNSNASIFSLCSDHTYLAFEAAVHDRGVISITPTKRLERHSEPKACGVACNAYAIVQVPKKRLRKKKSLR